MRLFAVSSTLTSWSRCTTTCQGVRDTDAHYLCKTIPYFSIVRFIYTIDKLRFLFDEAMQLLFLCCTDRLVLFMPLLCVDKLMQFLLLLCTNKMVLFPPLLCNNELMHVLVASFISTNKLMPFIVLLSTAMLMQLPHSYYGLTGWCCFFF